MPAYRVREHNNASKTGKIKTKRQKHKEQTSELKYKRRKDFRKAAINRRKAYVLKTGRYLLRGRSNTKEREIQAKV